MALLGRYFGAPMSMSYMRMPAQAAMQELNVIRYCTYPGYEPLHPFLMLNLVHIIQMSIQIDLTRKMSI